MRTSAFSAFTIAIVPEDEPVKRWPLFHRYSIAVTADLGLNILYSLSYGSLLPFMLFMLYFSTCKNELLLSKYPKHKIESTELHCNQVPCPQGTQQISIQLDQMLCKAAYDGYTVLRFHLWSLSLQ